MDNIILYHIVDVMQSKLKLKQKYSPELITILTYEQKVNNQMNINFLINIAEISLYQNYKSLLRPYCELFLNITILYFVDVFILLCVFICCIHPYDKFHKM